MPKFMVEREIPGVHEFTAEQLQGIAAKSNGVLEQMSGVQWIQSYVTEDRITCVYIAPDEAAVRSHIDPTTADGSLYSAPRTAAQGS